MIFYQILWQYSAMLGLFILYMNTITLILKNKYVSGRETEKKEKKKKVVCIVMHTLSVTSKVSCVVCERVGGGTRSQDFVDCD